MSEAARKEAEEHRRERVAAPGPGEVVGGRPERSVPATGWSVVPAGVLVVIPARDEAETIGGVVARVREQGFPALVVDDNSNDQTADRAVAAGARVLHLPFAGGAWLAAQTGIRYALDRGYTHVITMDADEQHDPADIPGLLRRLIGGADTPNVIIAACPKRASRNRRLAWRVLRWLSVLPVRDLTSGYRLYDCRAMSLLADPAATLLEFQDVGVLLMLLDDGCSIAEVPVEMTERRNGRSRVFSSWSRVLYYLLHSLLLSASKSRYRKSRPGGAHRL